MGLGSTALTAGLYRHFIPLPSPRSGMPSRIPMAVAMAHPLQGCRRVAHHL